MIDIDKIKTGKDLKKLRVSLNLPQEKFAHLIGYSMNRISFIETNNWTVTFKMRQALKRNLKVLENTTY